MLEIGQVRNCAGSKEGGVGGEIHIDCRSEIVMIFTTGKNELPKHSVTTTLVVKAAL